MTTITIKFAFAGDASYSNSLAPHETAIKLSVIFDLGDVKVVDSSTYQFQTNDNFDKIKSHIESKSQEVTVENRDLDSENDPSQNNVITIVFINE